MAHALPSFDRLGDPFAPASPVILSVPHAGREYPLALRAALRVPLAALVALEDRHADTLLLAARGGETTFIQRRARAWIDLNRAEHERDWMIDDGAARQRLPHASAKLRSGLGLVPRRAGAVSDIWRRRFDNDEIAARIAQDYRPYHAALGDALAAARARFGAAVLLDVHSMPPLGGGRAQIVIGDRFGRSAEPRLVQRLLDTAAAHDVPAALNTPYAGGHILERHADPRGGIQAVQIEIDRSLYLDAALDAPGEGFDRTAALLRDLIAAAADETAGTMRVAAE